MHDPGRVGGLQRRGGLRRPLHRHGDVGWAVLAQHGVQIPPGEKLHHQVEGAVVGVLPQVEHRHHTRVVEPAGGPGLAEEQLRAGGVASVVRQQFDRHAALDHPVTALPDLPHTAPADERDQLIATAQNPHSHR